MKPLKIILTVGGLLTAVSVNTGFPAAHRANIEVSQRSGPSRASRPPSTSGSIGGGLVAEHPMVSQAAGVLKLEKGGRVRSSRPSGDALIRIDVRLIDRKSTVAILVRGWPTYDSSEHPTNAYAIAIAEDGGKQLPGRVRSYGNALKEIWYDQPAALNRVKTPGAWHRYSIELHGKDLSVSLDGTLLSRVTDVENPQGFITLMVESGGAEFRTFDVSDRPKPMPPEPAGTFVQRIGNAVEGPEPTLQPIPRYTPEARKALIEGRVVLSGVVTLDGTLRDVAVVDSLDPRFGLDQAALETAKDWRFTPGTNNGTPVPVFVTFSMEFTLR